MENMMTIQEAVELTNKNALYIKNKVIIGDYVGEFTAGKKRNSYKISRYWLYSHVLYWPEWKIKEYHNSSRGKYWLTYDPEQSKRKKESVVADSQFVN